MGRNKMEINVEDINVTLDDAEQIPMKETPKVIKENIEIEEPKRVQRDLNEDEELINCLRNERIIVRHIPKESGMVTNPKHILYGGMAENATRTFVVPRLSSNMFVDILTKSEKAFLENIMGLEYNALSIYKKHNNFWDDSNESGISSVTLYKQDNYFDLSVPEDYIKYKILLANKNYIAPSIEALQDTPKATYQFVIITEGSENKMAKQNMSTTMECYKEYGAIQNDEAKLRVIIETIDGRPTSPHSKLEFLQTKINDLIQADSKLFLKVIADKYLDAKVLIRKCRDAGLVAKRGDFYYIINGNIPMCENGEEPTFNIAAKYLSNPKHQELKFSLEAKLK